MLDKEYFLAILRKCLECPPKTCIMQGLDFRQISLACPALPLQSGLHYMPLPKQGSSRLPIDSSQHSEQLPVAIEKS